LDDLVTRLHDSVTQSIVQQVVDRELATGEWLPRELDLAERHGVSRGVARETIQALRERGLVMVRHGRGAQVLPEHEWDLLDPVVLHALVTAEDRADMLAELIECRRIVEPEAAALAAERATSAGLEGLAGALQAMEDAPSGHGRAAAEAHPFVRAETAFHRALVAMAGNRPLVRMLDPVHAALALARHERAPGRQAAARRRHAEIHASVAARKPDAARETLVASVDELSGWLLKRRRT
jgi:DNA-binding FadR family transcriptional regulator